MCEHTKTQHPQPNMDTKTRNDLLVRVGGSHRLYERQMRAFRDAGIAIYSAGSATLGSKAQHAIIEDTPANRELLRRVGGTVAKRQWKHLKEPW